MIEVLYNNQLGNHIFQYCFGRILAERLNYKLEASPIELFPNTSKQIDGTNYSSKPVLEITDKNADIASTLSVINTKNKIVINGFFQKYNYYKPYKNDIKKWLITKVDKKTVNIQPGPRDVIVCIRRGDYVPDHALPFSYYEEALANINYKKIYVTSDSRDAFVSLFIHKHKAIFLNLDRDSIFNTIKSFKEIIISNSSFHWWAAFLSDANLIIAPKPISGFWSREYPNIDLVVDDDVRYKYLLCQSKYSKGLLEKLIDKKRAFTKLLRGVIKH